MFQSPGEVAFTIFSMPVYFYGLIISVAAFVGFYTAYYLFGWIYDKEKAIKILDFAPILIVAGLLGARLYYCLVDYSYYAQYPLQILDIRQGGLSIHGMILGGIIALWVCAKKYKLDFLQTLDCMACATALAQCIGRWGNFFNSEAFGLPTNLPWKLYIPYIHRPFEYRTYEYFHPAFLYESILDLVIFVILLFLLKKYNKYNGLIFGVYLLLYSFIRIGVEYLRVDSALDILGIPVAQWVSGIIIILALIYTAGVLCKK